ncbi:MAG: hypothetical protein ACRCW2_06290 [Cellulosilyticaceae bacterium]
MNNRVEMNNVRLMRENVHRGTREVCATGSTKKACFDELVAQLSGKHEMIKGLRSRKWEITGIDVSPVWGTVRDAQIEALDMFLQSWAVNEEWAKVTGIVYWVKARATGRVFCCSPDEACEIYDAILSYISEDLMKYYFVIT